MSIIIFPQSTSTIFLYLMADLWGFTVFYNFSLIPFYILLSICEVLLYSKVNLWDISIYYSQSLRSPCILHSIFEIYLYSTIAGVDLLVFYGLFLNFFSCNQRSTSEAFSYSAVGLSGFSILSSQPLSFSLFYSLCPWSSCILQPTLEVLQYSTVDL